jgi:hypothetical protein
MEMVVRSMETVETAMETDGDGFGGTSPSRQGARTETSIPRNLSSTVAALRNCSGKNADCFRVFLWKAFYRRSGGVRGPPGGPHHPWARPEGGAPPHGEPALWAPSGSLSILVIHAGKIGVLVLVSSNSENISCVAFLKHKKQQKIGNWHCGILSIG